MPEAAISCDIRDGRRQLFLDDWIVARRVNLARTPGRPQKHPANPVIRRDRPWDRARTDLYGSAVHDPENQRVQLFYSANSVADGHDDRLAYAESDDAGRTWTKPELGLIPFGEHAGTNIVMLPPSLVMHGPCVFRDEHDVRDRRYKLFTSSYPDTAYLGLPRIYEQRAEFLYAVAEPVLPPDCGPPGLYVAHSPDGIHWRTPPVHVSDLLSDTTQSAFWDARIGRYAAYVRARTANDRSVARMESRDFLEWTPPEVVLEGTPEQCIYSMGVTPYQGIYVGTPWIFDRQSEARGGPVIWPELAVSRYGRHWSRPFPGEPFIAPGPDGSADARQIRMSAALTVLDDRVLLLYGQTDRPHQKVDMRVDVGMATLRLDGFGAMEAASIEGTVLTHPLRFEPGCLRVNTQVGSGGHVSAEVCGEHGPVPGYRLSDCVEVTGDSTNAPLSWRDKRTLPSTRSGPLRLRFALQHARLFSFWVESSTN